MKLTSLTLVAALSVAGFAQAQTAPSSPPAPAASSSGKIDHACKKEIRDLCGRAHGQEMQDCLKSGLDMNKFSDSCKAEIKAHASKSSAAAKSGS
jgi:hypothetical protein